MRTNLVHLADELVDVGFPVAEVTALDEVLELPCPPAAGRVRELEWPEEVVGLLEVGANPEDFVNKVFHGEDVVFATCLFDNTIARKRNALLVDLSVATFVDGFTNGLEVRLAVGKIRTWLEFWIGASCVPVSDIWLNETKHLLGSLGDLDEDTVVDLEETEQLQRLALLGVDLVDTVKVNLCPLRSIRCCIPLDADDEDKLVLGRDEERVIALRTALCLDNVALSLAVLLVVFLSALKDDLALLLAGLR